MTTDYGGKITIFRDSIAVDRITNVGNLYAIFILIFHLREMSIFTPRNESCNRKFEKFSSSF